MVRAGCLDQIRTIRGHLRDVLCRLGNSRFHTMYRFIEGCQQAKFQIHTLSENYTGRITLDRLFLFQSLKFLSSVYKGLIRCVSRTFAKSNIKIFVTEVLTCVTKISTLDFMVVLDTPVKIGSSYN